MRIHGEIDAEALNRAMARVTPEQIAAAAERVRALALREQPRDSPPLPHAARIHHLRPAAGLPERTTSRGPAPFR